MGSTPAPAGLRGGVAGYALATLALVAGILSQYVFPAQWVPANPIAAFLLDNALTYGIGLVAFTVLVGGQPLRNYVRHTRTGVKEGLRWYGFWGGVGLILLFGLAILYSILDPNYAHLINQQTPVDQSGAADPAFYIVYSIAVGFAEETLFRGFLFGGALVLDGDRRWKVHALWTSLLFTGVHVYYAQTYQEISPIFYAQIFVLGLAFTYTYHQARGNLLMVVALHALYDATSFYSFISANGALALHYGFLLLAVSVAAVLYFREGSGLEAAPTPTPPVGEPPPGPAPGPPTPAPGPRAMTTEIRPPWVGGTLSDAPRPGPPPPAAGFLPGHCPQCGGIVLGDVYGVPQRCPRCRTPLRLTPGTEGTPFSPPTVEGTLPPGTSPPSPPPPVPVPSFATLGSVPPGAWPPA